MSALWHRLGSVHLAPHRSIERIPTGVARALTSSFTIGMTVCVSTWAMASLSHGATPPAVPPPAVDKPAATPPGGASDPAAGGDRTPKSLDELLGIGGAKPPAGGAGPAPAGGAPSTIDPAAKAAAERLDRQLSEEELDSLLKQALAGMRSSAEQLGQRTDTGLATQRVQQDVVAKLDILIEEAKRRCKQGSPSSCSSSSSSSQEGQKKKGDGSKPGERQAQQPKPGESKTRAGKPTGKPSEGQQAGDGPPREDGAAEQALLEGEGGEWGMLPERVREMIRQGSRDRIAALYQRLTEEYYRRMAEDASR